MKNLLKFQKDKKIKFKDKSLLVAAFTHKSSNQEKNNEKLEFLGDRVIGLVLSRKLFDLYPDETEGVLDKRFAALVNRKTCCEIAWKIGVQKNTRDKVLKVLTKWGGKLIEVEYTKGLSSSDLIEGYLSEGVTPYSRRKKLRDLLNLKPIVRVLEAHNGLTGLIVENTKIEKDRKKIGKDCY